MIAKRMRIAAEQGALAWWLYGIVEAALLLAVPARKRAAIGAVLDPKVLGHPPGALQAAVLLAAYPLVGALLGALLAVIAAPFAGRAGEKPPSFLRWSAAGSLALSAAYTLNALGMGIARVAPALVLALALAVFRLLLARQSSPPVPWLVLSHPLTVAAILVAAAALAPPRPVPGQARAWALGSACGAAVLLLSWAASRVRRRSLAWGAVIMLSLAAVAFSLPRDLKQRPLRRPLPAARPGGRRPNVILIVWDSVRADHLSLYGCERDTTPFLKRWAGEHATVYDQAIAAANWTLPSHAAILTGQHPWASGFLPSFPPSAPVETLAEALARAGYRTAGIAANSAVLVAEAGFARGFSLYDCRPLPWPLCSEPRGFLLRGAVRLAAAWLAGGNDRDTRFVAADEIDCRALNFLGAAPAGSRPFFLFINYMDAHTPYVAPPPFADLFPGRIPGFRWEMATMKPEVSGRIVGKLPERERRHRLSQYDGAIAWLDESLRRLCAELKRRGLYDNTLIVVTADHGESFGEKGLLAHGVSLYQGLIRVPLVVKFPGQEPARRLRDPVGAVDIFPTVLDVAGVEPRNAPAGRSLRRIALGEQRWIISETWWEPKGSGSPSGRYSSAVAVISGSLKAIFRADGGVEVYDLAADPGETNDLRAVVPLPPKFLAELAQFEGGAALAKRRAPRLDLKRKKQLESLHYLN